MKQNMLNEHYDVAIALADVGQEVYNVGDFSVILEDVRAKRVEGTRMFNANSDIEHYGYNDIDYTFIAYIYEGGNGITISTEHDELTPGDENELESIILEEKGANHER